MAHQLVEFSMTTPMTSETQTVVVEQIMREHDGLRLKLSKIHAVLTAVDPSSAEIEILLKEFLHALIVHFANEEDDGFFMNVSAKAPRLALKASELSVEHRALLQEAEELRRFAAAGSPSIAWWRELQNRCDSFDTRLMHHECEENHLMHDANQMETGACG